MSETYSQTKDADIDNNLIKISNSVLYRLKCDTSKAGKAISEEQWLNKLAALDKEHTITTGLDVAEAEKLLNRISTTYVTTSTRHTCPFDTIKLTECLKHNKGNAIRCEAEVQRFKQCVDKALHEAVAKNASPGSRAKKGSYMETFERMYQL